MWNQLTEVINTQSKQINEMRNMLEWQKAAGGTVGQRPPPTEQEKQELERERQRRVARETSDEPGLTKPSQLERDATRSKFDITKVKCHNCGQKGHMKRECPQPPKPRRDNRQDRPVRERLGPESGRRDQDYNQRSRDGSREPRRYEDRRSDSRQGRREDRGGERRDGGRYERSSERGSRSREWAPTRESRYGYRGRSESEDRREKKAPMSALPVDTVNPRKVAQEVVNILKSDHQEDLN